MKDRPLGQYAPLKTLIAKHGAHRRVAPLFRFLHGGAFSRGQEARVLVLYEPNRISYSQIYPFLMYAASFARRYDAQFRLLPTPSALAGFSRPHLEATHVLLQTWLTDPPEKLAVIRDRLRDLPNAPRLVYLDSFANADIRLARDLPEFSLYYKKSLLKDPDAFLQTTEGHTNLTDYYGRLYGIAQEATNWQVPPEFLGRLRPAPNFLTAPDLADRFLGAPPPPQDRGRDIDLHARFGGTGADSWYGAMRRDAETRVRALDGPGCALGSGIPKARFMQELERSRICFSPFGYGELCWRDIEAFATGSVLLKPDMSHLRTEPDLYRDGETYVALKWDFSDLEEKVNLLLADDDLRARIARTAWQDARRYLQEEGPVETYADIFRPGVEQ